MTIMYSTYEAKARFSEVLRHVRQGKTITISYRGKPAAEIRPIKPKKQTLEERLEQMEREGTLVGSKSRKRNFRTIERRPGALERFLADRNE